MRKSLKKKPVNRRPKSAPQEVHVTRKSLPRAWVVTADMGLGHQRAAWPLRDMAEGGIMTLGRESNTDPAEHKQWERLRRSYEFLSRTKSWPIIGNAVFGMLDRLQNIPAFYPIRDMSNPSFQVTWLKGLIAKGMCRGMLETIAAEAPAAGDDVLRAGHRRGHGGVFPDLLRHLRRRGQPRVGCGKPEDRAASSTWCPRAGPWAG